MQTFERLFGPEFGHGKPLGLSALQNALTALGEPHARLPPVFHVAGTNGKGSTVAFMRAIAEANGLSVHAFTKPHLFNLNERFITAGRTADDAALITAAERVAAVAPALTQFDAQIAAAFLLFRDAPADLVLLETGMGGRDDSTNVVRSTVTLLTPIALDHQDTLGTSLADIAAHKAGILKARTPAVSAAQTPESLAVIEAAAQRANAPLWRQGVEWDAFAAAGRLVVQTEHRTLDLPLPALFGPHQIQNAGLAAAALLASPFNMDDDAFARGVRNVRWPARLQPLTSGALAAPILAAGGEVWVDGGHNAHAATALAQWAAAMQRARPAPLIVIFGARARKDWALAVKAFVSVAERVIAVPIGAEGALPADIETYARSEGMSVTTAAALRGAIENAAQSPAPRVLIFGSLLLAAEALRP